MQDADYTAGQPTDQSDWPAHLRDNAPYKTCDTCGRKSWSPETRVGTSCGMPQPSGPSCEGHFADENSVMAETINYEAHRARHAVDPPLQHLTDKELEALRDAGVGVLRDLGFGVLRDLSFLARLELGTRHA